MLWLQRHHEEETYRIQRAQQEAIDRHNTYTPIKQAAVKLGIGLAVGALTGRFHKHH